jgi:hypothetical protein
MLRILAYALPSRNRQAPPADLARRLVVDAMVFRTEAEARRLDHCEASLPGSPRAWRREASTKDLGRAAGAVDVSSQHTGVSPSIRRVPSGTSCCSPGRRGSKSRGPALTLARGTS